MSNIVKVEDVEKVKGLFGDWENNFLLSCLQGVMGEVYSFDLDNPKSAVAVLGDFRMFAGEPDDSLLKFDYKDSECDYKCGEMDIIIPQNDKWAELVRDTFNSDLEGVSGASSYCTFEGGIEIEIDTNEQHRRNGYALICGASIILKCLEKGIYPSWDAHNKGSIELAKKLGYKEKGEYTAFELYRK